ncbi:RNA-directed RNA polymerase L [Frankliniella fusca]|uniref:RNA-directed RNA polymerase L n=1 Tax=Frankliniella fusca TaxID=407009 RepID=A0AAE1LL14_9NEOP|nr:RNA-directed RNA polymerase L [Frankliniella fusca]
MYRWNCSHIGDKSVKDSTQNRCKRCVQLEEENNLLRKQLKSAQLTGNNVLSELKEQISKVPELVRVFSLEKQFLKNDKFLVSLEDNMKNIQVGEDEIYCGNGIVVKKFDIYDVPEETTFGRRVNNLCDIFWKDKAYCHFLSGKCLRAPQDMVIYKITDEEIKAMKRILKKMSWEGVPCGPTDLSGHSIREVVKHYTRECLTRKLGGEKPSKQQQKQQLRKKTSSDSSDEGSLIQKANKKKRTRKTAISETENSSTSENENGREN